MPCSFCLWSFITLVCSTVTSQDCQKSIKSFTLNLSIPVVFNLRGREPFFEGLRLDIIGTQLHYICFIRVSDGGRWITLRCYNGPRYKQG